MSTPVGTLVALTDVFTEGTDGQYVEIDLTDGEGVPIDTEAIVGIRGTLRSLDTAAALFEDENLSAEAARASYPGAPGRVRVTFTAADLASRGHRQLQTRLLTLSLTHSTDRLFHCGVQFLLHNLGDVVPPAVLLHHRRLTVPDSPTPGQPSSPTPPTRPSTPDLDPGRPGRPDVGRPGRPDSEPAHPEQPLVTDPDDEAGESDDAPTEH